MCKSQITNWNEEKDNLYDLIINKNLSYKKIAKLYNCTDVTIKKHAARLIPNLPNRVIRNPIGFCLNCNKSMQNKHNYKGRKFCSVKCQHEYVKNEYINKWKQGLVDGLKGNKIDLSGHIRTYLLEKVGYKCELCGWNKINKYTGLCPLHVHHKDGNAFNNKEENLQVLCPNCHTLTDNYGSRNKVSCRRRSLYHTAKWRKELYNRK